MEDRDHDEQGVGAPLDLLEEVHDDDDEDSGLSAARFFSASEDLHDLEADSETPWARDICSSPAPPSR